MLSIEYEGLDPLLPGCFS